MEEQTCPQLHLWMADRKATTSSSDRAVPSERRSLPYKNRWIAAPARWTSPPAAEFVLDSSWLLHEAPACRRGVVDFELSESTSRFPFGVSSFDLALCSRERIVDVQHDECRQLFRRVFLRIHKKGSSRDSEKPMSVKCAGSFFFFLLQSRRLVAPDEFHRYQCWCWSDCVLKQSARTAEEGPNYNTNTLKKTK